MLASWLTFPQHPTVVSRHRCLLLLFAIGLNKALILSEPGGGLPSQLTIMLKVSLLSDQNPNTVERNAATRLLVKKMSEFVIIYSDWLRA